MLSDTETQIRIRGNNMICSPFVLLCKNEALQQKLWKRLLTEGKDKYLIKVKK